MLRTWRSGCRRMATSDQPDDVYFSSKEYLVYNLLLKVNMVKNANQIKKKQGKGPMIGRNVSNQGEPDHSSYKEKLRSFKSGKSIS